MNTRQGRRQPTRYASELIEDARLLFQTQYGHPVKTEEARQMLDNLVGFFRTLHLWRRTQIEGIPSSLPAEQVAVASAPELNSEPLGIASNESDPLADLNERPETELHPPLKRIRRRRFKAVTT